MDLQDIPAYRMPKQIWILVHHESPPHTPDILKNLDGVFNWTATYRFDSEILLTPLVKKRSHPITDMTNYARNKKRMVVWLVSNCKTPSRREEYVAELQKYIPVHIYGSCGQYSCLPKMSDECYQKLGKVYRYYLSFENSICKDYVTEKLYHVLNTNMVPVVLGGANYSVVAPPHSYINALFFKTPRDLAQYLLEIAKDDKKYNQFFTWKQTHELSSEHYACKICRMLNEAKMKSSTYIDISKWWFQEANCKSWS
ncbi:Glycoprotein 3-alpha-L-fucosyltransferase A, partial [Stegodyphus mimosarum]